MGNAGHCPEMRFIDQFTVILFDLHGTLMFDQDRFGPDEDYYATYRSLGGKRLEPDVVTQAIETCHRRILEDYHAPECVDAFPTLEDAFRRYTQVEEVDLPLLEAVFAEHERGRLTPSHANLLRRLSLSHQLGVVSNICARPDSWIEAFEDAGVAGLFKTMVFSSQGPSIKPSPLIFRRALATFRGDAKVLFVGDDFERDIRPARALGMGTAWISPTRPNSDAADLVIGSALELEQHPQQHTPH